MATGPGPLHPGRHLEPGGPRESRLIACSSGDPSPTDPTPGDLAANGESGKPPFVTYQACSDVIVVRAALRPMQLAPQQRQQRPVGARLGEQWTKGPSP